MSPIIKHPVVYNYIYVCVDQTLENLYNKPLFVSKWPSKEVFVADHEKWAQVRKGGQRGRLFCS